MRVTSHKWNWVEKKSFKDGHSLLCKLSTVIILFLTNQAIKTVKCFTVLQLDHMRTLKRLIKSIVLEWMNL